ncbi:response regulator transcription factor [Breznakia pachnodae]|uniref:Two-component system response regulator VanR n=1 Tax=Breznakia pachnodae TaxID=265178 RepID=A0ABU0E883_9FIRM|nr:response regulator transcription factor [Breznakia pachnodae]MDQ0363107.1 two-component system response regulator VanR [Breznakia pachnodae]
MKYKILVVEDEKAIQKALMGFLKREGYIVESADDGKTALSLALENEYHLILLDMLLPEMGGEEVLVKLREKKDTPVMIISSLGDELIQLDAYQNSIDDYIVKPFSMNLLLCKIAVLLKRIYPTEKEVVQSGDIRLIVNNYELYRNDEKIEVTTKEFELLQLLFLHKGRVFTREELYTTIWGYDYYGDTRTIDVHIGNIRKKTMLETITTIPGVGYKVEK